MGKFKVSFTTALFVFSFLICVIVAVVFVDRSPSSEYDEFYESDSTGEGDRSNRDEDERANGMTADEWERRKKGQSTGATAAAPAPEEAAFADLPLDPHLADAAQPVPGTAPQAAAQPTANPHAGKSPEQIAREMMARTSGVPLPQMTPEVPGMAVPGGIATPAQQTMVTATPQPSRYTPTTYLPMQSNVVGPGGVGTASSPFPSPGGFANGLNNFADPASGAAAPPSLSSTTNMGSQWNAVGQGTPSSMIGVRGAAGASDSGMMISQGKTEADVQPPLGFEPTITNDGTAPVIPGSSSGQAPLLLPPDATPPSGNKWELPPAPTLRPPPIQDPDQRRSDAVGGDAGSETPDSANPDGSSGQALAVSGTDDETPVESAEPDAIAARVNELELTEDQAARLAQVNAKLAEKPVTTENRQEKMTEAIRQWTAIASAAEQAREQKISVAPTDVEKYAAMRPDFDVDAWKVGMAEVGFTKAEIEQQLSAMALSEKLVEAEIEKKYEEKELRKIYDKTPKEYYSPRQVHVMEIFKPKPEDEKRAKRTASEMSRLQRQAAGGTDFGLLARQTSESPSKSKGGDLGWKTPEEKEDSSLSKAVADLKPGQVSEVVESEDGYRIYKVVAEKEATDSFEDAKPLVVEKLKDELRQETLAEAREKQEVELSPKKEIKVAKAKPEPASKKNDEKQETKKSEASAAQANAPRTAQTSQRPIQQAAANGQLLFAPGTPVQQQAGGAPAPAYQPGGQPAQQATRVTENSSPDLGYSPGETMTIGENDSPPATQQAAARNYAAPVAAGTVATPIPNLTPEMQALQLRALQARERQSEQQHNQQVQAQIQAARARAAQQAQAQEQGMLQPDETRQPTLLSGASAEATAQGNGFAPAGQPTNAPAPDDSGAVVSHSNGWTVTQTSRKPAASSAQQEAADQQHGNRQARSQQASPNDGGPGIPPGFGGSGSQPEAIVPQPGQPAQPVQQQQQPPAEQEREGGLINNVKSFFGGLRR